MKFATLAVALGVSCACFCVVIDAAANAPSANEVKEAAASFDAATRAYRAGRFELAASGYEAADASAPSAKALRMAIRSRTKAGQPARAATLAAWGLQRHADDEATRAMCERLLVDASKQLHEVRIACSKPCVVTVDSRLLPGSERKALRLFVKPGFRSIRVGFGQEGDQVARAVKATAGGQSVFELSPRMKASAVKTPASETSKEVESTRAKVPEKPRGQASRSKSKGSETQKDDAIRGVDSSGASDSGTATDDRAWYASPLLFGFFAVSTLGLGAGALYSGVDTLENPGPDAVREGCVGQGTSCPLYQEALQKQERTNILIGATAGAGAVTLLTGVLLTEWSTAPVKAAVTPIPHGTMLTVGGRL